MNEAAGLPQPASTGLSRSRVAGEYQTPEETLADGQTGLYPQFLLFGDSITQRACLTVQARLQDLYVRQADIVNRGFSGYTTALALATLPYFLPFTRSPSPPCQPSVRLITVFFGANDACLPGNAQHVPLSDYVANLRRMVEHCSRVNNAMRIVLVTPPPVNEWQLMKPLTRTAANTKRYASAARKLAADLQIPCLDLWTTFVTLVNDIPNGSVNGKHDLGSKSEGDQTRLPVVESNGDNDTIGSPRPKVSTFSPLSNHSDLIPGSMAIPPSDTLSSFFLDGLHLTSKAYDVVFTELVSLIRTQIPECTPENMPWCFRPFRELLDMDGPVAVISNTNVNGNMSSSLEDGEEIFETDVKPGLRLEYSAEETEDQEGLEPTVENGWHDEV